MKARQPSLLRYFLKLRVRLTLNWIGSKNHKIFPMITVNFTNQEKSQPLQDMIVKNSASVEQLTISMKTFQMLQKKGFQKKSPMPK